MRGWGLVVLLAGCDKLLGLSPITPAFVVESSAKTVAAGTGHTCWIDSHGALWCWGENDFGQIGNGSLDVDVSTPAPIDDQQWAQVSTSHTHTCAILADQTLWCWGDGAYGKLGNGSEVSMVAPVQVDASPGWLVVSAGNRHTCAIDSANRLWCWGYNADGELGDGTQTDTSTPEMIAENVSAVATGYDHTCAIRADGALLCWGDNGRGQLGDGTNTPATSPRLIGSEHWVALAAGTEHTCGVTKSGHARCWGRNDVGQLGNPAMSDASTPTATIIGGDDLTTWAGIAANGFHTCAWTTQGNGYCWGDSSHGELLTAGVTVNATPIAMPGASSAFAVGETHVCAVDTSSGLACAGGDGWGQLGSGARDTSMPAMLAGTWTEVVAGKTMTCAFDGANASCGGNNFYGQLGDGTRTSRAALAMVAGGHTWSTVPFTTAVGDYHACAIDNASAMWCWGQNELGQLGVAGIGPDPTPMSVALASPSAAAAHDHTCALGSGGLYCWGDNGSGELGDGTTTRRSSPGAPVPYPQGHTWSKVTTGISFTCALDASGLAWCWGRNNTASLGNNSMTDSNVPVAVSVPSGTTFGAIVAGGSHACAIDGSSQAWCWGYNGEGQLGVGLPDAYVMVATRIAGHTWSSLRLGDVHSCGIDNAGHLWCWGDNRRGELGNGDPRRGDASQPIQIGSSTWSRIAASNDRTCAIDASSQLWCWGSDDDGALLDGGGWQATQVSVPVPP